MNYFPTDTTVFKTNLTLDEINRRLTRQTTGPKKNYYGDVNMFSFKIKRVINYRNSFLPQIDGTITNDSLGSTITVNMKVQLFARIFGFFWSSLVGLGFIAILIKSIIDVQFYPAVFGPLAMLILSYIMTLYFFKIECNRSKKDFQTLFDAQIPK